MKKFILLILLTLFITGCGPKKEEFVPGTIDDETDIKEISDIFTIAIDEEGIKRTRLDLTITNNGDKDYYLEDWYRLEKKEDGKWYKLKTKHSFGSFLMSELYSVGESKIFSDFGGWEPIYGELPNGEYRIIRGFYEPEKEDVKYYAAGEFSIKEI